MKPTIAMFTVLLGMLVCVRTALGQDAGPSDSSGDPAWKLVWCDEFNKKGPLNPKDWGFETGFVRNEEAQWYQADNAACDRGLLTIEARKEQKLNPGYVAGSKDWRTSRQFAEYTSASVTTRGKHSWLYGRFEMRARIDTRSGLWPAFWTLGEQGEWPSNGEIDIMEYYRGDLLANVAWGSDRRWNAIWSTTKHPIASFKDPNWSHKFHLWRMDWDDKSIKQYVDGEMLNSVDLAKTVNRDSEGRNPFHYPHYMILNLAVGGMSGGDPTPTAFPAKYEIDFVRVYQRREQTAGR